MSEKRAFPHDGLVVDFVPQRDGTRKNYVLVREDDGLVHPYPPDYFFNSVDEHRNAIIADVRENYGEEIHGLVGVDPQDLS